MTSDFFHTYKENEQKKIKANAVSAYLLIFISFLFLFNKENKYINNDFVKSHVKSAFFIHTLFLITYIIFISYGVFSGIYLYDFGLNNLLASGVCIFLLFTIIFGIYKANSGFIFQIGEIVTTVKDKKLYDIDGDNDINERDKVTILLSYIPFIGYINYGKYGDNAIIKNSTKLNLIITGAILLLYIFSHENLANILSLLYITFVVFIGINLFTSGQLIQVNLSSIPSPEKKYHIFLAIKQYLKDYFSDKDLKTFQQFFNEVVKNKAFEEQENEKSLLNKKQRRIPSLLIYIPIINFIFLFLKNTDKKYHIINGSILSIYIIISYSLLYFLHGNIELILLAVFPILYGIGYVKTRPAYKMPFVYGTYEAFCSVFGKTQEFNKKYNKNEEISLKVREKKEETL